MQNWMIIPVNQGEYSQEILKSSRKNALMAMKKYKSNVEDFNISQIIILSEKWRKRFSYIFAYLKDEYNGQMNELIELSERALTYACHYENGLRTGLKATATPVDPPNYEISLAKHYHLFCDEMRLTGFSGRLPIVGDVLKTLCIVKMIQAAQCIDDDLEKSLDLLYESSEFLHFANSGENKIHSFFEYRAAKKDEVVKNGRKGAENRHKPLKLLRIWVIEEYKKLLPEKKWTVASAAAFDLIDSAIDHGRTINANITRTNGPRKIAEWINAYKKTI